MGQKYRIEFVTYKATIVSGGKKEVKTLEKLRVDPKKTRKLGEVGQEALTLLVQSITQENQKQKKIQAQINREGSTFEITLQILAADN